MNSPDFGAQAFLWWRSEIADRDLQMMQEAGFNWVKQAFAWEDIEAPVKGQYDWSIADRVVQQVAQRDLKLLARISSDPEKTEFWAGHPPGNGADFADFVFNLASRYNCTPEAIGCIHAYQIWNEPNLGREWGDNRPNPAEYVAFLGQAYAALEGRDYVIPDDIKSLAIPTLAHRIIVGPAARIKDISPDEIVEGLLRKVAVTA